MSWFGALWAKDWRTRVTIGLLIIVVALGVIGYVADPQQKLARIGGMSIQPQQKGVGVSWFGTPPPSEIVQQLGSWYFDWALYAKSITGVEFIPMSYNGGVGTWTDGKSRYLLVFNEPDVPSQANLTPTEGAVRYRNVRKAVLGIDPDVRFIVGGTQAWRWDWCRDFVAEYNRLYGAGSFRADGWHFHAYAQGNWDTARQQIEVYITWWQGLDDAVKGTELWITETGVLESWANTEPFMRSLLAYIPTQPLITRYAWYCTNDEYAPQNWNGDLVTLDGQLNSLGLIWAGLEATSTPTRTPTPIPAGAPTPTATASSYQKLWPAADTYVHEWSPSVNYGGSANVLLRPAGTIDTLLRFTGIAGVTQARLSLYAQSKSNAGCGFMDVQRSEPTWTEYGVTYNTKPQALGGVVSVYICSIGQRYYVDVTSLLDGSDVLWLYISYRSSASTEWKFGSRQGITGQKPELEIWR